MCNVCLWNVHIWALAASAADADLAHFIKRMCNHVLSLERNQAHPPTHASKEDRNDVDRSKLTRDCGRKEAALRQEWLRPLWLPSPVARWPGPRRLPSLPHRMICFTSSTYIAYVHTPLKKQSVGTSAYETSIGGH